MTEVAEYPVCIMPVTLAGIVRESTEKICDECEVGARAIGEVREAADGCRVGSGVV